MNREDLKKYMYSQKWIKDQLERYKEQRELVISLSQNMDGMPKAKNKPNYALEELLDQYDVILKVLNEDQKQQNKIIMQLHKMGEPYRTILTQKYVDGKKLEEIAVDIKYSYDRTCKMHGIALNIFDELGKSGQ